MPTDRQSLDRGTPPNPRALDRGPPPPNPRARFIVLEGPDAAGTTTQAALLADALRDRDLRVRLTAEPTDGPLGKVARAYVRGELNLDPHAAALVFTADRADHLTRVIRPALARGEWVVSDRYLLSTLAYQGADGVDRAAILGASASFDVPDLTIVLDVPETARAERLASRGAGDRYEQAAFASQLPEAYRISIDLLRSKGHRVEIVEASGRPQDVLGSVISRLDALVRGALYP